MGTVGVEVPVLSLSDVDVSSDDVSDELSVLVTDVSAAVGRWVAVRDVEVFDGFGGVRCELDSSSFVAGAASESGSATASTEPRASRTTAMGAMKRHRRSSTAAGASGSTAARCSRLSCHSHHAPGRIRPAAMAAPMATPGRPRSAIATKRPAAPARIDSAANAIFHSGGRAHSEP
ncbi:hypothetical protein FOB82_00215 [Corynebacterium xerosis]|uniref:Uncharacterized protein n=1 Tax=Corynebacterium xerosis TaxID=1725 RepID=A0A6B8TL22_9CORY|nr:hypothetical protein FOB82_00215 [Corynebacterium xerosis]